jgi:hypothetical protein
MSAEDYPPRPQPNGGVVTVSFLISLALLAGVYYGAWRLLGGLTGHQLMVTTIVLLTYLGAAYAIRPEPDTADLGWFGGMMDNPFSFTDDYNRFLLWVKILLLPGLFIVNSSTAFVRLVLGSSGEEPA